MRLAVAFVVVVVLSAVAVPTVGGHAPDSIEQRDSPEFLTAVSASPSPILPLAQFVLRSAAVAESEQEPNDGPSNANSIRKGATVRGKVATVRDLDAFTVSVDADTRIVVELQSLDVGGTLQVAVYDPNLGAVASTYISGGSQNSLQFRPTRSGHYHVVVSSVRNRDPTLRPGVGKYALLVNTPESNDGSSKPTEPTTKSTGEKTPTATTKQTSTTTAGASTGTTDTSPTTTGTSTTTDTPTTTTDTPTSTANASTDSSTTPTGTSKTPTRENATGAQVGNAAKGKTNIQE